MNGKKILIPEFINTGEFYADHSVNFHSHLGTELILLLEGACTITVNNRHLTGTAGTLFIIPAHAEHNQISTGLAKTIYTVFNAGSYFDETPRTLKLGTDSWIEKWLKDILTLNKIAHQNISGICASLVNAILQRLAEIESTNEYQQNMPQSLVKSLLYIEQNFTKPISLDDIAKHTSISPGHLCALFKKHLNKTLVNHMLEIRLHHSKRLLRDSYLSIKEISNQCGFNDINYFCRRFKKHYKQTPGAYRKSLYNSVSRLNGESVKR